MEVGIAYNAFVDSFRRFFPNLEVINNRTNILKYKLIIFPGGEDVNPAVYGQRNTHSHYSDVRDRIEMEIFSSVNERIKNHLSSPKILGVCRGHQLINVLLGGNMVQDIFFNLRERHGGEWHGFNQSDNSKFMKFFTHGVNSYHHQGVIKAGRGLYTTAITGQIIEACESDKIITVQFHPEFIEDEAYVTPFFDYIKAWANTEVPVIPLEPSKKSTLKTAKKDFETMTSKITWDANEFERILREAAREHPVEENPD